MEQCAAPGSAQHAQADGEIEICVPARDVARRRPCGKGRDAGTHGGQHRHRGPYDELGPAYHTLSGWIQEHGHEIAGPLRELYLNDPQEVPPDEVLTEVQWPIDAGPAT